MKLIDILMDEIFPKAFTCNICADETFDGKPLCPTCAKTVYLNDGKVCPVCGRNVANETLCINCAKGLPKFKRGVSGILYKDGGVKLIFNFKHGHSYLKDYFADTLEEKCKTLTDADAICYVPMTKKREKKRGYNQARLLAKELGKRLNLPVWDCLKKVKESDEQKLLTKHEREQNLSGCFKTTCPVKGKTFILVDDVFTTGATANIICEVLLKKGASSVYFASACCVPYRLDNI